MSTIAEQLAAQGLRLAHPSDAGRYVLVEDDGPARVWATDATPEAARAAMARDVAWCEALRDCGYPIARVASIALGVDGPAAARVAEAATFGEDIAAAIRAAKS